MSKVFHLLAHGETLRSSLASENVSGLFRAIESQGGKHQTLVVSPETKPKGFDYGSDQ